MESVGLAWYKAGTVNLVQGSATVTGVGTNWLTIGIKVGDLFTVDDTRDYEIASVTSNTQLTLVKPFQGASGAAQNYAIIRNLAATLPAELAAKVSEAVGKFNAYIDADLTKITGPRGDPGWAYKGPWTAGRSYNAMDVVVNSGNALYIALSSHTSASSNAPGNATYWMSLGVNIQNASETVAGVAPLATAAEVATGENDTKIVTSAKIALIYQRGGPNTTFLADSPVPWGFRYVPVDSSAVAASKTPFYELYGTISFQAYDVVTFGSSNNGYQRIVQEATEVVTTRKFRRIAYNSGSTPVWTKWTEVPTLSYSPNALSIIVDGDNGDDATANGTEARAYRTLQAAFDAIPKLMGGSVSVRIKAGTYTPAEGSVFKLSNTIGIGKTGLNLTTTSFSGNNDVELVGNTTSGGDILYASDILCYLVINNINFSGGPDGSKAGCGIFLDRCSFSSISHCAMRNILNATTYTREGSCIVSLNSRLTVSDCEFSNAKIGIYARNNSSVVSGNNTSTSVNVGLRAVSGVIRKSGTQPTGTVTNEQVSNGGQIL